MKPYVANFFFTTRLGICPTTMTNMTRLQAEFASYDDVVLLSHSVTPETDTVEALASYAEKVPTLRGKWFLATSTREKIYDLGRNYDFTDEDLGVPAVAVEPHAATEHARDGLTIAMPVPDDFLHTESFVLIDQHRRIRGIYNGMNGASAAQLIADVHTLRRISE